MPAVKQAPTRQAISLKGSTSLVTEFFKYAANTSVPSHSSAVWHSQAELTPRRILFQRGVYPADDFQMVKKYGQTVLVTQDLALENYLDKYVDASFCGVIPLTYVPPRILSQVNSQSCLSLLDAKAAEPML